jgi:hypothetical protein
VKPADLRTIVGAMSARPWTMTGRPYDRAIESVLLHPDGASYCVAEELGDDDAAGIVALANHGLALLDAVDLADALVSAPPESAHAIRVALRCALAKLEALP